MVIMFNLQKEEHVKKIVMMLMVLAMGIGSLFATMAPASAQTLKQVNNGMQLVWSLPGTGAPKAPTDPSGACTLGPVGTDKFGNLVGITAGHCSNPLPYEVYDARDIGFGPIGTFAFNPSNNGTPESLDFNRDYQIIKFDKTKVFGSSNGPALRVDSVFKNAAGQVALPPAGLFGGANICKDGNATGKTCGIVVGITPVSRICANAVIYAGDSGGPAVVARNNGKATEWVGINNRAGNTACFPFEFLSAKAILDDLNPRNVVGSGFTVINTP